MRDRLPAIAWQPTLRLMRSLVVLGVVAIGCGRYGFAPVAADDAGDRGPALLDAGADAAKVTTIGDPGAATCKALPASCGATGAQSCCDSPLVAGGRYSRGFDISGDGQFSSPVKEATVADFRLDKYEVTVGRFRQFADAGMGTQLAPPAPGAGVHPGLDTSGWDPAWDAGLAAGAAQLGQALRCDAAFATWTAAPGGNENRPINCVSWLEASAFCAWDGGYLPTEAEWNYAAAGGAEQRAYPWSSPAYSLSIDESRASYFVDPTRQCRGDGVDGCAPSDVLGVGSRPAGDGKWGHSDLAGNVWEWTLDGFADGYLTPCVDCANLAPTTARVVRGGAYDTADRFQRSGRRLAVAPEARQADVGFRCARAPSSQP